MTRLPDTSRAEATQAPASSGPHGGAPAEEDILEAEKRVRDQEAHVLRLIVQGAPTQSAEDLLRRLTATAEALKERRRLARG
jgi:hypothetical protein